MCYFKITLKITLINSYYLFNKLLNTLREKLTFKMIFLCV